jgi:hypothetical protein
MDVGAGISWSDLAFFATLKRRVLPQFDSEAKVV